jgi:Phage capsid family
MFAAIKGAKEQADQVHGYTDFVKAAACIMTTRGAHAAAQKATALNLPTRIVEGLQKAAQPGGATSNVGISAFGPAAAAFMATSRNLGFADEVARSSMLFPDMVGRVMIYSQIAASTVAEGAAKPIRALTMSESDFTPTKVANMVVLSRELIDALGDVGVRTLGNELRRGVAVATDTAFLTFLAGNSHDGSISTGTWADFLIQFDEMLRNIDAGSASKLFLVVTSEMGKGIASQALANGIDSIQWNGGNLAGVELRVSDAQTAGRMTMIDATGLVVRMGELELSSATHASIQMDTAPSQESTTPTAAQQVSMFQTNSVALRCERSLAVKAVRTNSFMHVTGVTVGDDAGSPALP